MKQTTEAIVFSLKPHSDRMSVLQAYTVAEGNLKFLVYGAMGRKRSKVAYQPMSVVDITYDCNPARPMPIVSSVEPVFVPNKVYEDMRRLSIALFATEILMLTLIQPMRDEQIYAYVRQFVTDLNSTDTPENMHLAFMIELAYLMGIGVPLGELAGVLPADTFSIEQHILTDRLMQTPFSRTQRKAVVQTLCAYYASQLEYFRMPKSLDVLSEVFD